MSQKIAHISLTALACIAVIPSTTLTAAAQIAAYISGPTALATDYNTGADGIRTNTFDTAQWTSNTIYSAPISVPSFGTYQFSNTNRGNVFFGSGPNGTGGNGQYGNGTGNFLGFGDFWTGSGTAQSGASIQFASAQRYFGFAWNAGDGGNTISFYSGGTLLAYYATAQTLSVIPKNSTVQSNSGATYQTNDYYGQPGTGSNTNESYTYLNFFGTNGFTFDKVVLSNVGGSGFESDNHSVSTAVLTPVGTFVPAGFAATVVPEANSATLMLLPLAGCMGAIVIRRRKSGV